MSNIYKILLTCSLSGLIYASAIGQDKSVYEKMSLDELLNVDVVVTASKKPEDLFEAPLSVTIIKREDIDKSGATSIPEALRLAPGLIVREITPGNYDIHIRGYDDITKNVYISLSYNTTTLIMIDNRIVFNYFTGGTLWETFPIDLNDVQQIEVVRGPASALYGPNAVTGVINIITTHAKNKGMNVYVNGTVGNKEAKNASTTIGYNWNDKTKLTFSGNYTERHRFDEEYFDYNTKNYTSLDNLTMALNPIKDETTNELWTYKDYMKKIDATYNEDLSLRKLGGNIFFNHRFSEQSNIDIAAGAQNSQSLKTGFYNLVTPLSQIESKSYYVNARIKQKNLSGQFDVYSGHDYSNYKFNSYRFTNIDANLEYFKQFNKLSFRPGISYKRATYNSPLTYNDPLRLSILNYEFKDETHITSTYSASLLSEWKPISKLRIIGAVRIDKININKNFSFNYEIASTYRLNKDNLVRFTHSRASRSVFIIDNYLNCNISLNFKYKDTGNIAPIYVPVEFNILGKEDLKFPTITSQEIGWRTKINPTMSLDVEVFYSWVKNLINPNVYRRSETVEQISPTGQVDSLVSIKASGDVIFENFDLEAKQFGTTISFTYDPTEKINIRLYGTYQKTKLSGRISKDFKTTRLEIGNLTPENTILVKEESRANPIQWSEKLTPSFFGGFVFNYIPSRKWNLSTDGYFYSDQEFTNNDNYSMMGRSSASDAKTQMKIKSYLILNAKASYKINENLKSYIRLKNLLGDHREYGFADQIGRLFQIGISWELK